jgi:hypothetical protein
MDSGDCVEQSPISRLGFLSTALLALMALATPSWAQNPSSASQQYEVPKQAPPGSPCPERKPDAWLGFDSNNCVYERPCPDGGYAPSCAGQNASSGPATNSNPGQSAPGADASNGGGTRTDQLNSNVGGNTPYHPPQGWAKSYPFQVNPPANGQGTGNDNPTQPGNGTPYRPPGGWANSYPFIVKPPAQPQSPSNGGQQ